MNSTDFNQALMTSIEDLLRKDYPEYNLITDNAFDILKFGISSSETILHVEAVSELYKEFIDNDYTI